MSNVSTFPGSTVQTGEPNAALIGTLEKLLGMAKSGELQCFIGTGFTKGGLTAQAWVDLHPDVYQMLGAIEWLKSEYAHRHTEGS